LADELPLFIAKAEDKASPRKSHFNLGRPYFPANFRSLKPTEAQWEVWCLDRWNISRGIKTPEPIKSVWHRLVAHQVPIESPRYQRQLLTIDLIGISEDGFPVVVEMKGNTKQAAVLALILQALDYAIRLKTCWPYFFREWQEALAKYKWPVIQQSPNRIHVVCAAPDEVWQHEQKPRFAPNTIFYAKLLQSLESCGFPVSLVGLCTKSLSEVNFEVVAQPFDFVSALDAKAPRLD